MTNQTVTLKEQLKAVGREVGMRRSAYPKWVNAGRMSQTKADIELAAMSAAYNTLKRLEAVTIEGEDDDERALIAAVDAFAFKLNAPRLLRKRRGFFRTNLALLFNVFLDLIQSRAAYAA